MTTIDIINDDLDYHELDRLLSKVKSRVFLDNNNAAFLGSIMSSLNFSWTSDIKTACTNGSILWWNPYWFLKLPKMTRVSVLVHELWHVAALHMFRRGDRNPTVWNWACDLWINNTLKSQGYTFEGTSGWWDPVEDPKARPHNFGTQFPEAIYDTLMQWMNEGLEKLNGIGAWGSEDDTDLVEPEEDENSLPNVVTAVAAAQQAATMAGEETNEVVQTLLKRFLQPKIAWEEKLYRFMEDTFELDYSMRRPNRRHQEVYLPSLVEEGGLEHLIYFLDVSGSVTDGQAIRFNSEVKYIKDTFNPRKLTLAQFDTRITDVKVFTEEDPFDEIVIIGRGGTSLVCVRDMIIKEKPTAVVIFSDLECTPMEAIPNGPPILWIAINNTDAVINQGEITHIRE